MGKTAIQYEFIDKPEVGNTFEIAAGVHWLRMPLPFALELPITSHWKLYVSVLLAKGEIHTEHDADNVIWYRQK